MLYLAYQTQSDSMQPVRLAGRSLNAALRPWAEFRPATATSPVLAGAELLSRAGLSHVRPDYGITKVATGVAAGVAAGVATDDREVRVTEETVASTPFGTLLRFRKDVLTPQPKMLVVAPLSGHFATLLRDTVRTLLRDHDVYITDWHNARDIPVSAGRFGFEDYVDHVIRFLEVLGPGSHVLAVCQPCVQVLAAVAMMAETNHPAQPRSMTLMAGPVDTRVNPTRVNTLAVERPISWFERRMLATVPWGFKGAGRRVYPGFVQLLSFMSMNMERHRKQHLDLYVHLARGETEKAEAIKAFYDEYFSVLDLTAEFYIETVRMVFQEAQLATGELRHRGHPVDLRAIRHTALLTVEGERDDICGLGQTAAAHTLCTGLRPHMRRHHMQAGAGHYGIFNGRRWESQIYPVIRNLTLSIG
ncbi:MAG TPA: polyhydroxyalkanoate depolymerase [Arenibaculum sp.]|nr:polyhydroxyalkanoate depolymerase [Arenibaculum sp.]